MKLRNQKTGKRFPSYSYSAMSIEQFNVEDTQILFADRKKNRCIEECSFLSSLARVWEVFWKKCCCWCKREKHYLPRTVHIGQHSTTQKFPPNVIRNQKYNIFTFIPVLLFEQFRVFLNLCFLIMALSQFVPSLRIGYLYTYWGPLGFVLFVTFCREAVDDIRRWKRDREVNSARYTLIVPSDKPKTRQSVPLGTYHTSISGPQTEVSDGRPSKPSFRGSRAPMYQRRKIASSEIKVGDVIIVEKDQRVPADLLLLRTSEKNGACFIRTDQLDGETDWKLRLAVQATRTLERDDDLFNVMGYAYVEAPRKDIYTFEGNYHQTTPPSISRLSHKAQLSNASAQPSVSYQSSLQPPISSGDTLPGTSDAANNESLPIPLSVENTLWSNTVVASGTVVGLVIYTGSETRSVMNSSQPRSKVGLTDKNINHLTILLTMTAFILALVMISFKGYGGAWYKYFWRFFLLFSYIIPLALRVNLDMSKITYSFIIMRDKKLQGCLVRNTTIPEELGRISYLLSDKTGTLTQNEMIFKKLHLGNVSYGADSLQMVSSQLSGYYAQKKIQAGSDNPQENLNISRTSNKIRKTPESRLAEAVKALALCHNVTPMSDDSESIVYGDDDINCPDDAWDMRAESDAGSVTGRCSRTQGRDTSDGSQISRSVSPGSVPNKPISYQASSPDEVALVAWTETVNLTLIQRDLNSMKLRTPTGEILTFNILEIFSFTSESKRMGIIVQEVLPDGSLGEITFYMKGADVVMSQIVSYTDWLEEETGNMAREGLRTLIVAKKALTQEQYDDFAARYRRAKTALVDRPGKQVATQALLEKDLELLCVTGVEDKLQEEVTLTLEVLQQAGVRVWMLTGDKLETAICIAQSSRLVPRTINLHVFKNVTSREGAHQELNNLRHHPDSALIITGGSLEVCLAYYEHEFMELACQSAAVVVCRCSPTQKATIVELVKRHTGLRVAAIGDGGNDVSMIQAADVGIGLEGKEGKQASLASDFSLLQFKHVAPLLLVHGRRSYKNTATLSQFIIHRGAIISVMQVIFSAIFYFAAVTLFPGLLMVGYSTLFTMFPVFSLILDKDISDEIALRYPELYKDLRKGRDLNFKTFFIWVLISIYQGFILIYGALLAFEDDFVHVVSITFTALVLTELLMVALTVRMWHWLMVLAEFISLVIYIVALIILPNYFDQEFLKTVNFLWKTLAITGVSCIPLFILKFLRFKLRPPIYAKLK